MCKSTSFFITYKDSFDTAMISFVFSSWIINDCVFESTVCTLCVNQGLSQTLVQPSCGRLTPNSFTNSFSKADKHCRYFDYFNSLAVNKAVHV